MNSKSVATPILLLASFLAAASVSAEETRYTYEYDGQSYTYSVVATGESYTFDFEKNPGVEGKRVRAVGHVFRSVFDDDSVAPTFSEAFMKEGATCLLFDARFYTYKTCFLPNDSASERRDRFWGFVSRLPNVWWFVTRNILPAALAVGLFFYFGRKRSAGA